MVKYEKKIAKINHTPKSISAMMFSGNKKRF
jgi:hypothetical protein